jgi:hypothetical protein
VAEVARTGLSNGRTTRPPAYTLPPADLVEQYPGLPLSTADAFVVAVAEKFRAVNVATLDRRHFSVVRPCHVPSLALFP